MKQRYVVTGGAGFIGSKIAQRLIDGGHQVVVLDNLSTGREENIPPAAEFIKIDLGDESAYASLGDLRCDALLHLAGQSSGEASFSDPVYDFHSHVTSTFFLLDWCRKFGVNRVLYASSMSLYGDQALQPVAENRQLNAPKTYYAASKAAAESYLRLYQTLGVNTTLFRMFSVYGPGQDMDNLMQGMLSIYLSFMLRGEPILVKGSRERFRDFIYIDDVVDAWVGAIDCERTFGKTYNLASGQATKVDELIAMMKRAYGDENYPVVFADSTPGDQFGMYADMTALKADLGWRPQVSLEDGLKRMMTTGLI